jgi:adenine phosphoribosyltransferase
MESRGFILGAPVAYRLGAGFVPVRKPGKLPSDVYEARYELEYGSDALAIHQDAVAPGEKVLIVDDVIATGGTVSATVQLIKKLGGVIQGIAFLIELTGLRGRNKLDGYNVISLVSY